MKVCMCALIKYSLIIFIPLLDIGLAKSDPAWFSAELSSEDCDNEKYADSRLRCYSEFYNQQILKMEFYIKARFKGLSKEQCIEEEITSSYEKMESSWLSYAFNYCSLESHCIGYCGSGHDSGTSCMTGMMGERYERLYEFVHQGMNIWGCNFRGAKSTNTLVTSSYTINIIPKCDEGLWDCREVVYMSVENEGKNKSISLVGNAFNTSSEFSTTMPLGYVFQNSNTLHKVFHSGVLQITDLSNGKIVLEEQGVWH